MNKTVIDSPIGKIAIFAENEKILAAMFKKVPVEHRGIKYGCVSAFIIRVRSSCTRPLNVPRIFQAELMSATRGSVTIADPKEVNVLNEYQKGGPKNE